MARKYVMSSVGKGDYLLPSNDGKRLYRISSYVEDGTAEWQDAHGKWRKVTGTFWQGAEYDRLVADMEDDLPDDFLEWDRWSTVVTGQRSRQAVVDYVVER